MKKIVPILVIFLILFLVGRFLFYNKSIMDVCRDARGRSFESVSSDVLNFGLKLTNLSEDGTAIIHSTKNFGRGVCILKVNSGVVKNASFELD